MDSAMEDVKTAKGDTPGEPLLDNRKSSPAEKSAYFNMLRLWVNQTQLHQNASQCFPYYLMAQGAPFAHPANQSSQPLVNGTRLPQRDEVLGVNGGGYEFIVAPMWKRCVAEIIDVAILFLAKLLLTLVIVDILKIDLGTALDFNSIKTGMEGDDYTQLFNMASEIFVLELITKVLVCVYEMLWTMQGQGNMLGGATPGKLIMGIRILHVETVVFLDPEPAAPVAPINGVNFRNQRVKALLYPALNPGWKRAFSRAFIKNATMIIPLIYPVYFVMLMFKNNRTIYDVMTKTIVVEENQMPVLRRM